MVLHRWDMTGDDATAIHSLMQPWITTHSVRDREKIHALAAEPPVATSERAGPAVTRASLQADLLAAHDRAARLHSRVQHLEQRLSEASCCLTRSHANTISSGIHGGLRIL